MLKTIIKGPIIKPISPQNRNPPTRLKNVSKACVLILPFSKNDRITLSASETSVSDQKNKNMAEPTCP